MKQIKCIFSVLQLKLKSWQIVVEALQGSEPPDDSSFLRSGWRLEAGVVDLPEWFEENRVQGHTRLPIQHLRWGLDRPAFQNAAAIFREKLGARVYTRHVKTCSQSPWWPTAVPTGLWDGKIKDCETGDELLLQISEGRNVVQEMVDEARREGAHFLAYYWHMSERVLSKLHELDPSWICKDLDCTTFLTDPRNGPWLDLSETEYREIVLQRLLELAGMGVDGFLFDSRHLPKDGCWCSALANAFTLETAALPPTVKDLNDPLYRQFLDFKAYKIEETFAYWKKVVKNQFPHVVFVISTTGIPVPHSRYETTNLVRLADSAKNEYKHALSLEDVECFFKDNDLAEPDKDIQQAFGWVLLRDSADGRLPHIWEGAFPDRDHTLAAASALVTYGAIANMNVNERILAGLPPEPDTTPQEGLEAAFSLGRQVSPYLGHSRPLHWAAVHFSELVRNRRGGDLALAWQEVLWPVMGAFGGFIRAGLPCGIVNDYQLEQDQLEGYQVLFLPNPDELTHAQKNTIRRFVARGGILLKNNRVWPWSDPNMTDTAVQAFRAVIQRVIKYIAPAVQVLSSAQRMHAVAFEDRSRRRLVVAVTNDYSWVQWRMGNDPIPQINLPPAPIKAVVLVKNRRRPLQITEVLSGTSLVAESIPQGYKVRLPEFPTMVLLVVQE